MSSSLSPFVFDRAAIFARNAQHGRNPPQPTEESLWAQRIYHNTWYRTAYTVCALTNMLLAWWEPPADVTLAGTTTVSGGALVAIRCVDAAFLLFAAWDLFLQSRYHGFHEWIRRGWVQAKMGTVLCLLLNLILTSTAPLISSSSGTSIPYVARILRPLLLIERLRNVRKIAGRVATTAPRIINVGVLLALHMLLSSILGFVLFAGLDDTTSQCTPVRAKSTPTCSTFNPDGCHDYFADLGEAMIHLFELTTAANFPAIMMPSFKCNKANALFFVVYILISFYLLLNLTLAVTYSTFREEMKEEVITKYRRAFKGFDIAFADLCTTGTSVANTETLKRHDFIEFFRRLREGSSNSSTVPADAAGKFFDVFDGDGRGEIDRFEFRRLLINFGKLRVRTIATREEGGGGSTTSSSSGGSNDNSGGSTTLQALADSAKTSVEDEDEDEDESEVEVLETTRPMTNSTAVGDGENTQIRAAVIAGSAGAGASPMPTSRTIVMNPLSASNSSNSSNNSNSNMNAPNSVERSFRVDSMRGQLQQQNNATATTTTTTSSSSSSSTTEQAKTTTESTPNSAIAESWGKPRRQGLTSSMSTRRLGSSNTVQRAGFCSGRFCENLKQLCSSGFSEETTTAGYGGVTAKNNNRLPKHISPFGFRGKLVVFLRSSIMTGVFDLVVLLNSLSGLAQLSLETNELSSTETTTISQLELIQYVTLSIFVAEVLVKLAAWGPRAFWKESALHKMDISLVAASLLGVILGSAGVLTKALSSAIMFIRFLRLVRVLRVLPGFGLTVGALGDILPVLGRYAAIIACLFYSYAIIGMIAFGDGKFSESNPAMANTAYAGVGYYELNFDTFPGALLCLFYLLVLNDWPILMEAAVAATGTKAARGYFISFWIVCVVLCLNVVIAFVIEAYSSEKEKRTLIQTMEDASAVKQSRSAGFIATSSSGGVNNYNNTNNNFSSTTAAQPTNYSSSSPSSSTEAAETGGVEDWKKLIVESGVDFSMYHLSKMRHHLDIYDALYRQDIRAAHSATFAPLRKRL